MTVHQILFLRNDRKRRSYCTCGWIAGFWCEADDIFQNFLLAQDDFIAHLEAIEAGPGEWTFTLEDDE